MSTGSKKLIQAAEAGRTLRRHELICLAIASGALLAAYPSPGRAGWVAGSAAVAFAGFLVAGRCVAARRHRLARDLLIARADDDLAELHDEQRRLLARSNREHLAGRLEHALEDAQRWERLPPARRPPPGFRSLRNHVSTVRVIVCDLRGADPGPRGVAMAERLLEDGSASALYAGDDRRLGEELRRISYELESANDG